MPEKLVLNVGKIVFNVTINEVFQDCIKMGFQWHKNELFPVAKIRVFYDALNGFLMSLKISCNKWLLMLQKIGFYCRKK